MQTAQETDRARHELRLAELAAGPFVPDAETLPVMLWMGDSEGRCVYLNRALRESWGAATADTPRFPWTPMLVAEDPPALFEVFSRAMATCEPFVVKARYRRADGTIRVLKTSAEPRFAPNGAFLGMVGLNEDLGDARG